MFLEDGMNGAVTACGFSSAPQYPWPLFCDSESYEGFGTQLVGLKKGAQH